MTKRRFLSKKQVKRLIAGSKIRKHTKENIIRQLNGGGVYGGKPSIMGKSRIVNGPGDKPISAVATFYHWTKDQIHEVSTPPRYKVK